MTPNTVTKNEETGSVALKLSLISISAALYAVAIAVTSPVPTPWGVGHFRPGVVIPAFFAVVFGPIVGGVGAAIGCFLGDFALSFFGLTTPLLSLVAGVPGNFVGFYLLGLLVSKRHSLSSFILSNFVALIIGNLIASLGVLAYFWFIVPDWALWSINLKIAITVGLTLFWVVTMVVFVVPLVPILVAYIEPTLTKMGVKGVSNLNWSSPIAQVKASATVALALAAVYVLVVFVPGGNLLFAGVVPPELLLLASVVILASGLLFAILGKKLVKA
ncbi:MAG: ECF transporter S component [Candidatus Bathyarchaeota archaeon]|nr:ECF transporter S component [Candidatus Bathyarchaeota archaeon]